MAKKTDTQKKKDEQKAVAKTKLLARMGELSIAKLNHETIMRQIIQEGNKIITKLKKLE